MTDEVVSPARESVTARAAPVDSSDRHWHVVARWQEFEAEGSANLLRVITIASFYALELVNFHGLHLGPIEMPVVVGRTFHLIITALVAAWLLSALAAAVCLSRRFFPTWLKYVSTTWDIGLLSVMLMVADGPRSPLLVGYFVILALAALRLSRSLVIFATAGVMGGYVAVLGYVRWFTDRALAVPRHHQVTMLLAVAIVGLVLARVIDTVRRMATEYASRLDTRGAAS